MHRDVARSALEDVLQELSYPAIRTDAATEFSDVTVGVQDREVNLGAVVDQTDADVFQAPEDLLGAVQDVLADEEHAD